MMESVSILRASPGNKKEKKITNTMLQFANTKAFQTTQGEIHIGKDL